MAILRAFATSRHSLNCLGWAGVLLVWALGPSLGDSRGGFFLGLTGVIISHLVTSLSPHINYLEVVISTPYTLFARGGSI